MLLKEGTDNSRIGKALLQIKQYIYCGNFAYCFCIIMIVRMFLTLTYFTAFALSAVCNKLYRELEKYFPEKPLSIWEC